MEKQVAIITGAAGQDGLLLTSRLLSEGFEVIGLVRDHAQMKILDHYSGARAQVVKGPLSSSQLTELIRDVAPSEIYNLASSSSVAKSWQEPGDTLRTNLGFLADLLQALTSCGSLGRPIRVFQASSSEMFGNTATGVIDESTPLAPSSPYAASKAACHTLIDVYRSAFGLDVRTGILFNHESPLRPEFFVTRKITRTVAKISLGLADELVLGSMDISRDWGYAPDYVDAMIRIMRDSHSEDYVVASGHLNSLQTFVSTAFTAVGIDDWQPWTRSEVSGQMQTRPQDHKGFTGNTSKISRNLGWRPTVSFTELVNIMVQHDLQSLIDEKPETAWRVESTL